MKKLLLLLLMFISIPLVAQNSMRLQAEYFCFRQHTEWGWDDWSEWQPCDIAISMDLQRDLVVIYSKTRQSYKIVEDLGYSYEDGGKIYKTICLDEDGQRCRFDMVNIKNQVHIYIRYSDAEIGYIIKRL